MRAKERSTGRGVARPVATVATTQKRTGTRPGEAGGTATGLAGGTRGKATKPRRPTSPSRAGGATAPQKHEANQPAPAATQKGNGRVRDTDPGRGDLSFGFLA